MSLPTQPPLSLAAAFWLRSFRALGQLPLVVLHVLGWVMGWMTWSMSRSYRRHWRENTQQAAIPERDARAAVGAAGQMIAELPRLWFGRPVPTTWEGGELIEEALQSGRSVLFLTPHLSAFELTVIAYAQAWGERQPISVLFQPPRKTYLSPLLNAGRVRPGVDPVPTNMSGVKRLLQVLKKGGVVGLLPDQVPPPNMGVVAPFFGKSAYTMTLAARLAELADEVLLASVERLAWGRGYVIRVTRPESALPEGDHVAAAGQVNLWMEKLILRNPAQYLWGYNRYK